MTRQLFFWLFLLLSISSCIQDDFIADTVDPEIRITTAIDTLALNTEIQLDVMYLNNVGREEQVDFIWESLHPDIVSVTNTGLAKALQIGSATLSVHYETLDTLVEDFIDIEVGMTTVMTTVERMGTVQTTSSYALSGDFNLYEESDKLVLDFDANYNASTALPGLYVYLSNNRNTVAGAYEIGAVETFSGAHTYQLENIGINDYKYVVYFCKPFNVKVGDGEIF